jgi:hypothetical protein
MTALPMPHVLADPERFIGHVFRNAKGHAECVEFILRTLGGTAVAPWRPGIKVRMLNPGEADPVAKGTAIATFVNGKYPDGDTGQHAAIYLGQNSLGIQVLDQWRSQDKVLPRTIYWSGHGGPKLSNDGTAFSVIEW